MASLEAPAVSTIITHTEELIMTFSSDLEIVTGVLFSTGFIQDDVLLKLTGSDDTPKGKAALLVEAVTKEIELAPEKFTEFLKILSENFLAVDNIVDGLLATYQCFQESLTESVVPPSNVDDDQPGQLIPLVAQVPDMVQSKDTPSAQALSVPAERVLSERDIATLLNLIHNFSDKWNEIGIGLGFAPSELKQISSNPSLFMSAPASFLTTLLSQWVQWPTRDHPTKPMLGALCEALRSSLVGLGSLAEQVERELKCSTTEMLQAPSAIQSSPSRPQSPGRSTQSAEMVRSNMDKIKALFSSLLVKVQSALHSQQSDISNMRQFLITFFKCSFPETSEVKKLLEAVTLNDLWDYQHYSPLEQLIDHFLAGDQELEGLMKAYKARLSGFHLTTKLIDYIEYQNLSIDESDEECDQPSPKLTTKQYRKIKVVLQLERKISQVSLDYVVKLWQSFAEEYEIPSLTAVIDRIVTGSIEISWLIPTHVAEMIKPRSKFFRKHHIMLIFIDDIILYDEKEMTELEQNFLELYQRAASADVGLFTYFLEKGVDPDIYNERGAHPLVFASYHNRVDLVQLLLQYHATVDMPTKSDTGDTALMTAVEHGHLHVAEILVKNGASVNYRNKKGQSVLWLASYHGHTEIVLLLLHHHASVDLPTDEDRGETPLFAACSQGRYAPATVLISNGADVNYLSKLGDTPMYYAAQANHLQLVELLLSHGGDINKGVQSPLYIACQRGNMEMVQLLVHHHAAVDQPCDTDIAATPLITASSENHIEVARFLVGHGAGINLPNKNGNSPLQIACIYGNTDIVKLLIQSNADIELQNKEGRTGLMIAAWRGHLSTVMELVRAGAKTDLQDQAGLTSLILAVQNQHVEVVEALLNAHCNPNIAENTAGWSALHFAAKSANLRITKLLLQRAAATELRDKNGLTALEICEDEAVCDELVCHIFSQTTQANTQPIEKEYVKKQDSRETTEAAQTVDNRQDSEPTGSSSQDKPHSEKHKVTEEQRKEVKKSYQKLLRIFDLFEDSLLPGRKQKMLHQQREASNIAKANQQLV